MPKAFARLLEDGLRVEPKDPKDPRNGRSWYMSGSKLSMVSKLRFCYGTMGYLTVLFE